MQLQVFQTALDELKSSVRDYDKKVIEMREAHERMVEAKKIVDELFH